MTYGSESSRSGPSGQHEVERFTPIERSGAAIILTSICFCSINGISTQSRCILHHRCDLHQSRSGLNRAEASGTPAVAPLPVARAGRPPCSLHAATPSATRLAARGAGCRRIRASSPGRDPGSRPRSVSTFSAPGSGSKSWLRSGPSRPVCLAPFGSARAGRRVPLARRSRRPVQCVEVARGEPSWRRLRAGKREDGGT